MLSRNRMGTAVILCALVALLWGVNCAEKEATEQGLDVKTGFIESGMAKLYFEEAGEGRPIVMIHGGLLNAKMWDGQFERFARRYRVVRYDARGHGRSTSEPDTFSHHEDLRSIVKGLGLEKPVIMGLSMGGYIAIDFALEYPDMPGALVLVSPGLTGYEFKSEEFIDFRNRIAKAVEAGDSEAMVEAFQTVWTDGPRRRPEGVDPAVREKVRLMVSDNVERWDERNVEYRPLPFAIERLDSINVPVLVVVGDIDMPGILEIVDLIESRVPGARRIVVPNVAHMINMEKPAEFDRIVLEFLDGLP
jgi:3-oxoadipate enol-lactonase